ncbi:MAG: hypothetical protein AVDCRST_MAG30-1758, partial [uncultured Solirubrobacteraceae bacterium]
MSGRRPLAALAAGWALLLAAWIVGNPPFAAPDEASHHVRALAIAEGDWTGTPASVPTASGLAPDVAARQAAWVSQSTRSVAFSGPLPPADCYLRDPRASAACLDRAPPGPRAGRTVTTVATYQPLPYLLPAALMPAAGASAGGADRLARLGT